MLSIGAGLALLVIGRAAERGGGEFYGGGWFGYTPLSPVPDAPFLLRHSGLRLLVWLVLIAAWVALSLWLFHDREGSQGDGTNAARRTSPEP